MILNSIYVAIDLASNQVLHNFLQSFMHAAGADPGFSERGLNIGVISEAGGLGGCDPQKLQGVILI